jgi:oligopeptidase B
VQSPHGTRDDPYYWLRDDTRANPEVLAHLHAENDYSAAMLAPAQPLIDALYAEIVARIKQDDSSVPVRDRGYYYSRRYETGKQYPIYVRRPDAPGGVESVLLDCNVLAAGEAFFQLGDYEVSQDNRLLAYTIDTVGRRQFRLRVLDLASGELLDDVIDNVEAEVVWADDNRTLLYVEKDPVTLLGRRVRRHTLGAKVDPVVYEEPDESFDLGVSRSKSQQYLYIGSQSTTTSEWRFAAAADPALRFNVFMERSSEHEYQIEHLGDRFLVRTNWNAQNFRIMTAAPPPAAGHSGDQRDSWRDVVAHDPEVFVHDFEVFQDFLVVSERSGGLRKIRVQTLPRAGGGAERVLHLDADDPAYAMYLDANPEIDTTRLRYTYTSLTTPTSVYEYDMVTDERVLLKREQVLGSFDPADYASELLWAPARDAERVPVSVVYRKNVARDGSAPLYLYGYGAYGHCIEPAFSSSLLSLLERGFICAIAHVRGGQELGRRWYDDGRLLHKRNSFNDFLDATDFLIAQRYATHGRVYASGGSAGGLLVGAIANMAPEKFGAIVADVPFVDIVTTMLDESIPLTTLEYDEWGDPSQLEFYNYMLSYSPYDNVRAQHYPPVLVTTGLWDSQVQYYEPAKWVARLRDLKKGSNPVLLHINMEAGHGGQSGRFERLREVARAHGFLIAVESGRGSSATGYRPATDAGAAITHPTLAQGHEPEASGFPFGAPC